MSIATQQQTVRGWSVDLFRGFWTAPDPAVIPSLQAIVDPNIVGHWPRPIGLVRRAAPYINVIEAIFKAIPDFSLRVPEHAANGDFTFVRWIASGTDHDGPFECNGCDRIHAVDGIVVENFIFCDHPFFQSVARHL